MGRETGLGSRIGSEPCKEIDGGAKKKAASDAAKAKADKLNEIAGAATKKLNDAKKDQEETAAAAKLKQESEDKVVAAKNEEAAKIKAAAEKASSKALAKKAAAKEMLKKIDNAKCVNNAGCKGLQGYCCPTLNTNTMHLGSTKLDGENLGCCGGAAEMTDTASPKPSGRLDLVALLAAAVGGSAVTAFAFKMSAKKASSDGAFVRMGA